MTCSAKEDIKILSREGIKLCNFFDVEIANYVLYAGLAKSEKPDVWEYFSLKNQYETEMVKMGVDKLYNEVEIPLVSVLVSMEEEGFRIDEHMLDGLAE